jgi:hypothetical protein
MPFCKSALATLPPCRKTQCCLFVSLESEQEQHPINEYLDHPEARHRQSDYQNQWNAHYQSDDERCVFRATQLHFLPFLAGNVAMMTI